MTGILEPAIMGAVLTALIIIINIGVRHTPEQEEMANLDELMSFKEERREDHEHE